MEPWTPSDEWIARINKARRFFNRPKVIMVAIVFNWIIVAVSMFFALRDGDGRWLMMAIFWTIFAAYIGPRQYAIAKAEEEDDDEDDDDVAGDAKRAVAPVDAAEINKSDDGGMIVRSGESGESGDDGESYSGESDDDGASARPGAHGDAERAAAPVDAAGAAEGKPEEGACAASMGAADAADPAVDADAGVGPAASGESDEGGAAEGDEFRKTAASGESKCDESKEDNR